MIDLDAARDFMTTHARVLDRRRFAQRFDGGAPEATLAALAAYRNPDGGYGWALEPDLRAPTSQPAGALHAFEFLAECGPVTDPAAAALCDWLGTVSLPDGGLPFALEGAGGAGAAPFWAGADPTTSNLQITAGVTARALQVARHDPAVADHPWTARALDFCWTAMEALGPEPGSLELRFALWVVDSVGDRRPDAPAMAERLMATVPANGERPVEGGIEGEAMRPLDWSPAPGGPTRDHLDAAAVERHLDELEAQQDPDDGGFRVDFTNYSPAAVLDWRGYRTVEALTILAANGRL